MAAKKKHKYRSYGSLSGGEKFAESYRNSQETGLPMEAKKTAKKKPVKRSEKRTPKRSQKR